MKHLLQSLALTFFVMFTTSFSCAQNGPTQPSVVLTWTQSVTPGVTANCVYRGTVSKTYTMPALFCSATPIITYTDLTVVRGNTYYYVVTAKLGAVESGYSNEVDPTVPQVAPPTGNGSQETKLLPPPRLKNHAPEIELQARVVWSG